MDSGFTTKDYVYLGLGAVGLYLLYRLVTKGTEDLKKGLNITSHDNYANRIADKLTETASGEKGATIGNKIYDFFNPPNGLRIDVITAAGEAVLANGTVLQKGWRVEKDGSLYDRAGKLLGKAS
jgi:hypothetical protein